MAPKRFVPIAQQNVSLSTENFGSQAQHTTCATAQVYLKDVIRVFHPNIEKKPNVFKIECRRRS